MMPKPRRFPERENMRAPVKHHYRKIMVQLGRTDVITQHKAETVAVVLHKMERGRVDSEDRFILRTEMEKLGLDPEKFMADLPGRPARAV